METVVSDPRSLGAHASKSSGGESQATATSTSSQAMSQGGRQSQSKPLATIVPKPSSLSYDIRKESQPLTCAITGSTASGDILTESLLPVISERFGRLAISERIREEANRLQEQPGLASCDIREESQQQVCAITGCATSGSSCQSLSLVATQDRLDLLVTLLRGHEEISRISEEQSLAACDTRQRSQLQAHAITGCAIDIVTLSRTCLATLPERSSTLVTLSRGHEDADLLEEQPDAAVRDTPPGSRPQVCALTGSITDGGPQLRPLSATSSEQPDALSPSSRDGEGTTDLRDHVEALLRANAAPQIPTGNMTLSRRWPLFILALRAPLKKSWRRRPPGNQENV